MKRGFTIVELLMVIGIISVLLTIVTYASLGSLRAMRMQRAEAGKRIIQQGLATYYAQKGYWPGEIGSKIKNGGLETTETAYELSAEAISGMMRDLIAETKKGNPMLDFSGLFVSRSSGEFGTKGHGLDFWSAVRGTKRSPKKMTVSQMHFGYADPYDVRGYFRRYRVVYSVPGDEMMVKTFYEK
ncbi:MAG: type II secretion system protein [Kiritimatiellae bacterium]|nr:type II secretion system protein [Kiritimatiellia bacterium]